MKIFPIANNYNIRLNSKVNIKRPECSALLSNPINADTVSFSGKAIKDLRKIPHITCGCCGIETMPPSEIDRFMATEIYLPAQKALKELQIRENYTNKHISTEKSEALKFCNRLAENNPDKNLSEILDEESIRIIKPLLPEKVRQEVKNIEKETKTIAHSSTYLIEKLSTYEDKLNTTEKKCFNILKKLTQKYPNLTFSQMINIPEVKEFYLTKLEKEQEKIWQKINKLSKNFPKLEMLKIQKAISEAQIIFQENPNFPIEKRGNVIKLFKNLESEISHKEDYKMIFDEVNRLPSSKNNVNAFLIKYSHSNPNEIVYALLQGSKATIEHVKPARRLNDNGKNDISNYVILCHNCNSERSQIPYNEFIKTHPQMPQNMQKYLDIVIENINNGLLPGFEKYPDLIQLAVKAESNGEIALKIDKLNLQNIKNKRKK